MAVNTSRNPAIQGTRLAEVLSVSITPCAKEYQVYGTIMVEDCEGPVYIFYVWPEDSQTISSSNGSLVLFNTGRAILALNRFTVSFDLKDKNGGAEFIRGLFSWNRSRYNTPLVENIEEKLGSATVRYIVHWVAVETTIGAKFVMGEGTKSDLNVHGKLVARFKNRCDDNDEDLEEHCEFTIFEGTLMNAKDGDIFPIDRSVLALPCYMSLVIRVHLRSGEGDVLWNDQVEFSIFDIVLRPEHKEIQSVSGCGVVRVSAVAYDYVRVDLKQVDRIKDSCQRSGSFPYPPEWSTVSNDNDEDVPTHPKKPKESHHHSLLDVV